MSSERSRIDLHIVTPCARPANLEAIAASIVAANVPTNVALHWMVVLDDRFAVDIEGVREAVRAVPGSTVEICAGTQGIVGHAQRNYAIDRIHDGWIIIVDDDNRLHPLLPETLAEVLDTNADAGFIVFAQDLGEGEVRETAPENVRIGRIDAAQFALERGFVADVRFDEYALSADGIFAQRLYLRAPGRFVFVPRPVALYNALNAGQFGERPPQRLTPGPLPRVHTAASLHFHRAFANAGDSLIAVGTTLDGGRLCLSTTGDETILRCRLRPGRQLLRGRAWLDRFSSLPVSLRVILKTSASPDVELVRLNLPSVTVWRTLVRVAGGKRFAKLFEAVDGAEIEFSVAPLRPNATGRSTLVLDSLTVEPQSNE